MIMISTWLDKHVRALFYIALALMIAMAGILVWDKLHPRVPVTFESQEKATTSAGVEKAANAAQASVSSAQAAAIANEIKKDEDKPPDVVVQTTGAKLKDTIKTELQKSGGQFAIVTEPKKDSTDAVPFSVLGKTPTAAPLTTTSVTGGTMLLNTPVTLNQYNIKAYPERLIQVGGSYQEVFAAYSWKVSVPKIPIIAPHGDVGYLGVYGHANMDHPDMSRIGIMLTIPK